MANQNASNPIEMSVKINPTIMFKKVKVIISEKYRVITQNTTKKSMNMWYLYSSPRRVTIINKQATQNRMKKIGCNGFGGTAPNFGSMISC